MNLRGAAERELSRRSFAAYVRRFWPCVTGAPLVWNRAIAEVVAVLQRVADGEIWRVLIALPSGVGKSTLIALYAGWRLARNPGHRSIHMTHAADLAGTESRRVRRLVEGDEHRAMFPALQLRADESTVAAWATTSDGRYYAVGQESALLGRRAHEAVLDDPLDASDRFSGAARESLWTWFQESLSTRLDGDRAPIIVVHQRLCVDDLIGRLREQGGWHLLELPAEFEDGELLAPTVLSRVRLDEIKARSPRAYATMFLQRPSADDGATIARSAWRFHAPAGSNVKAPRPMGCAKHDDAPTVTTPERWNRIAISVDMTFGGTKTTNDYCSIQAWGSSGTGRYLLDRWKRKASQREQREQIKAFNARFPGARLLIEKAAGGAGAIEELIAEGITNIEPVVATVSKAARLDTVSPGIELGLVFLPLGAPWLGEFVEELAGASRHDDDQDACSQALHYLNTATGGAEQRRTRWNAINVANQMLGGRYVSPEQRAAEQKAAADRAALVARAKAAADRARPAIRAALAERPEAQERRRLERLLNITRSVGDPYASEFDLGHLIRWADEHALAQEGAA